MPLEAKAELGRRPPARRPGRAGNRASNSPSSALRRGLVVAALLMMVVPAGQSAWLPAASTFAALVPAESVVRLIEGGQALDKGSDRRLTVLLLGSDSRGSGIGRTDALMVASLRGSSIVLINIPRDMASIPLPGGGVHHGKINEMLAGLLPGRTVNQALAAFQRIVEHFLAIEIDYHALIKFDGFTSLMTEIEPVTLRVRKEIRDGKLIDDRNRPVGVYFPARSGYPIYGYNPSGPELCNGLWKTQPEPIAEEYWCHRGLPFVRSRKGPSNSDFARATRQQDLVMAAVRRVLERGSGNPLNALAAAAEQQKAAQQLWTNIPLNAANALDIYDDLRGASLDFQTVLKPPTYATAIAGSTAFEPKLAAIWQLTKQRLDGTGGPAATPRPTQPPSAPTTKPTSKPTATATASATPIATSTPAASATATAIATTTPTSSASPTDPGATLSSPTSSADPVTNPTPTASPTALGGAVSAPAGGGPSPVATGGAVAPMPGQPGDTTASNIGLIALVVVLMLLGGVASVAAYRRSAGRHG